MTAKLSQSRSEGTLTKPPTHMARLNTTPKLRTTMGTSFTSAPEGYNQAPVFPKMLRDSNSSNGLFLGSPFSMTEAGPGSYPGIDKSTCLTPGPSKTRVQTVNRRPRDCRPLGGSAATLSLHGADRLFLEEGPGPGKIPSSSFALAQEKNGFCSSVFASEQARFVPVRESGKGLLRTFGMHEKRKYKRVLPARNPHLGEDGLKVEDERTKTRNRRIALLVEQKKMAVVRKAAKEEKKLKKQKEQERLSELANQLTAADFPPGMKYKARSSKSGRSSPGQSGRASPPNAALMATATVIPPFDGIIDWDQSNEVEPIEKQLPPPAQFKNFDGWKAGLVPLNFDYGSFVRPWTTSVGHHRHHQSKLHTSGSSHSVRFGGSVTGSITSKERMGFSRGGNDDGSMTADITNTDTVRFKEKRKMVYPWMKDMFKETISKDDKQDIGVVEKLDSFKAPNTTLSRFY